MNKDLTHLDRLNNMDLEDLLEIHNIFCQEFDTYDDYIREMSELENELEILSGGDVLKAYNYGKFATDMSSYLNYFKLDGYGNLKGMSDNDVSEYCLMDIEDKIEMLLDNGAYELVKDGVSYILE